MGTGDKMLRGNLQWTSIPSRESSNTPSWLHATEASCGPSAALSYLTLVGKEDRKFPFTNSP